MVNHTQSSWNLTEMQQHGDGFIPLPQGPKCQKCPRTCEQKKQLFCNTCADSYALSKTCVTCGKRGVHVHRPMNMLMKYCPEHHEEMVGSLLGAIHYQKKIIAELTSSNDELRKKRERDTERLNDLEEDLRLAQRERDRAQQDADEARMEAAVTKKVVTGFIQQPARQIRRSPSPVRQDRRDYRQDRSDRSDRDQDVYSSKRGRY
jgi:hypothetical protein